jgi:hypothetical protein
MLPDQAPPQRKLWYLSTIYILVMTPQLFRKFQFCLNVVDEAHESNEINALSGLSPMAEEIAFLHEAGFK